MKWAQGAMLFELRRPMPVQLHCSCGKLLRVRDDLVGKRVRCPGCAAAVLVKAPPSPEDQAVQQAPPPRQLPRAAAEVPRARHKGLDDEPERAPEARRRPRPGPSVKRGQGNLVLWLAVGGGAGLVVIVAVVLVIVLSGRSESPKGPGGPDGGRPRGPGPQAELGEGFITNWLLLAPIPLEVNQSGADALGKEQIKDEAKLRPRAGDVVRVGARELVWTAYRAREHFFDFNDFLGGQTEDSVGYAVCYVHAPGEMQGVQLRLGSDDQTKVYLNGQEVFQQNEARALAKDQNTVEVTLRAGVNVLVLKVINEKRDWSGCARFTDAEGHPIRGLKVTTTPG
jgi:DNA-directed RNA polymerase subunit RPC12/RpoP